jgi:hypothetical protein
MAAVATSPIFTDNVTRVYKNSSGTTIAIQDVIIMETRAADGYGTIERTAILNFPITRVNEGAGQSRTITTIQQIGQYDSYTEVGGNYTEVVYNGSGNLGDLTVDLSSLPTIGSTI